MVDVVTALLILTVCAFTPPLLFLGGVRRMERFGREPWGRLLRTFAWGAIFAVIIGVILSLVFFSVFQMADRVYVLTGRFPSLEIVVLAIVIAPFTEEFAKGIGVYLARPILDEPEDGIVYGAASGFGFAASENLLYGLAAFAMPGGTLGLSVVVIGVRSISSALLHASASATFGYGIGLARLWPARFSALPYYLFAVAMHAGFNLLASLGELYVPADTAILFGLAGAIIMAVTSFAIIRAKVSADDALRVAW
jgi:RsiW-degrading membrane proteinase PrsW (M82 family)